VTRSASQIDENSVRANPLGYFRRR